MVERILVTGGAGFVGCNLVDRLLSDGREVTVFDLLSRRGAEFNLEWLIGRHGLSRLRVVGGDIRSSDEVGAVTRDADIIYHLAAQVAVTSSVADPRADFEINALGTFNVLEGARLSGRKPIIVFTSTNKVYGAMEDVEVIEQPTRYEYRDYPDGIPELRPLDFHSPYGCSKGAADQYVRDYMRIYDLPAVVFRMSCIYGPRQFGTEDQGWLAHLMISALRQHPINIYGDGKQVRDILFIDDLVRAFKLAVEHIDSTSGEVFNIGGGPSNTISVWAEFSNLLTKLKNKDIPVRYGDWRPGDQRCYVSDIRKARRLMGWQPQVEKEEGISRLWEWISSEQNLFRVLEPAR